ncbi:MAG: response regulator transcription factor [Pseudomonadota bacterium]
MEVNDKKQKIKVLVIDDDKKLCRLIKEYLEPMGYLITAAHTGPDGLELALTGDNQAIILDVMLPEMDGFEVLKRIRTSSDIPVLMLTALGDETDRIVGLEMGADDYLPKTFSTRELLARLRAVTRRSLGNAREPGSSPEDAIRIGELKIESEARQAFLEKTPLDLTPIEFKLLFRLAQAAGRVLSRDQLMDEIAARDYQAFDRSIDMHISSLRRKLGDDPKNPRYIKTIRSFGYMMQKEPRPR